MSLPSPSVASAIAFDLFAEPVVACTRFTTGLRHWVYDVVLTSGRNIVVRLSHPNHRDELEGGIYWMKLLREQGIDVPELFASDLAGHQPFMVLERLAGTDLGNVFDELTPAELRQVAASVREMQRRTSALPPGSGFGYALSYESPLEASWKSVLEASVSRSSEMIRSVGVVSTHWGDEVRSKLAQSESLLDGVAPVAFLHDATTKNVVVADGAVSGLVDVDEMAFGDPLWATALTRMSLLSAHRPVEYIDYLMGPSQSASDLDRLDLYTAIFCLGFLAEIGQRFNKAEAATVDSAHRTHLEATLAALL